MNTFLQKTVAFVVVMILCVSVYAADIAIVGATLIDGTGGKPVPNSVLLIRDSRIISTGSYDEVAIPENASVIDAKGKYIIPGLMDGNIHLILDLRLKTLTKYEGHYEQLIREAAQIALKYGVTTVFDSWGPRQPLVNVRNEINAGKTTGSRIFLAGNIIGIDSPISGDFSVEVPEGIDEEFKIRIDNTWVEGTGSRLLWMGPEQVRDQVRNYLKKDIDFMKYLVSGHMDMKTLMFSPRVQKVMIEEAHRAGKTIQTHTSTVESLHLAIELGVDLLQHCAVTGPVEPIPAETIELLAKTQIPCTTLSYTNKRLDWHQSNFPNSAWTKINLVKDENIRKLVKAGANLLLSTDAGVFSDDAYEDSSMAQGFLGKVDDPLQIGEGHFNWLKAMEERGMKAMDMLKAATINIARAYKVDKDIGTLEPGKIADLLILNKNPLDSSANYRDIYKVIKEGTLVDRDVLPVAPELTAPARK